MKYYYLSNICILKPADGSDCSLNGLSARYSKACLFIPSNMLGLMEPIKILGEPKELNDLPNHANSFILKRRTVFDIPHYCAYPKVKNDSGMFGGNFLYYSGNGFHTITGYPIPIHDRYE